MNRDSILVLGIIVVVLVGPMLFLLASPDSRPGSLDRLGSNVALKTLPLRFEENQGQTAGEVEFLSRSGGFTLFLTRRALVFAMYGHSHPSVVRMNFAGSNRDPELVGLERQATKSHYFIGSNPKHWRTNVDNYSRVEYRNIYPGISLVLSGASSNLNAQLIVLPGADPSAIRIRLEGAEELRINSQGHLAARSAAGELLLSSLRAYQEFDGVRKTVAAAHRIDGARQWTLQMGNYDPVVPLVVDFQLFIAVGGSADDLGIDISLDSAGNIYLAGSTNSADFPTSGLFQSGGGGFQDAFVTKLNTQATAAIYSTYIGGRGWDVAVAVDTDAAGNTYLLGGTVSSDFPTAAAFQRSYAGGLRFQGDCCFSPNLDAFVAKLSANGDALIYSTYLGGTGEDVPGGIAVDNQGNATVVGLTDFGTPSGDFPTFHPFQARPGGGLADAFVTRLDAAGKPIYSTYLGGNQEDVANGVAVDASGNAYIAGTTNSFDFPAVGPIQTPGGGRCFRYVDRPPFFPEVVEVPCDDAFVAKLNAGGSAMIYSTVIGGSGNDGANAVDVDDSGNVVLTGVTRAPNFPTTTPFRSSFGGGFVTKLNSDASALIYSSYLPPAGRRILMDASGNAYVNGSGVMKLNRDGVVVGSTFPFASGLAVSPSGAVYLSGTTDQSGLTTDDLLGSLFLSQYGGYAAVGFSDAFIARLLLPENYSRLFAVGPDSGVLLRTDGTAPMSATGYARAEPYRSEPPSGLAFLSYRKGNTLVSETAIPASFPVRSARVFVEAGPGVNTNLAIVNPNMQAGTVSFFFTDPNGTDFGHGAVTIPANGQVVRLINQPPFNLSSPLSATLTLNASVPVGVTPIRIFTNERSDPLLSAIPVVALPDGQASLPYFADGGGWATRIVLVNPTDQLLSGAIQFWGPGTPSAPAQPVIVDVDGQSAGSFSYRIPPRSSRSFRTSGASPTARTGSVRAVSSDRNPFIAGIMSYKAAGTTISETIVPPVPRGEAFRVYVQALKNFAAREPGSIETYVVITNPSADPVTVDLRLARTGDMDLQLAETGDVVPPRGFFVIVDGQRTLFTIPGNGQRTFPLAGAFSRVRLPFQGILQVSVYSSRLLPPFPPRTISVVALRAQYNEAGELKVAAVPAIVEDPLISLIPPPRLPPSSEDSQPVAREFLLFPYWIDGGGYATQFLVLGGSSFNSSYGLLKLFGQSGETLKLPLR